MPAGAQRLRSLDALRGFDMVWIVGGREAVLALAAWTGWGWLERASAQLHHAEWHGFTAWDLIFPLFLFLAGVSFPLSLERRRARGDCERSIRNHALRRGLLLVALGVLYNIGPHLKFDDLRYASVLGRIGLAWMFAALIALRWGALGQWGWIAGLLLGYWLALTVLGAPDQVAPSLAPGETLTDWIDRAVLPGRLHRGVRDPEWLFSTLPAIATALLGMSAGRMLRGAPSWSRALRLAGAGAACLTLGWLWSQDFPLNKNLWTSSFALWTAGWSMLSLAVFHGAIDVAGWGLPATLFAPIGANALGAYLITRFVDQRKLVGGNLERALGGSPAAAFAGALAALLVLWLALAVCRRRGWHLRI